MVDNIVNDIRDKIKSFKKAREDNSVTNEEIVINREMLENYKKSSVIGEKDRKGGNIEIMNEIKNSLLREENGNGSAEGEIISEKNHINKNTPILENSTHNDGSYVKEANIPPVKSDNPAPIKETPANIPLPSRSKKTDKPGTVSGTTSNNANTKYIMIEENLKLAKDNRSSSNGKVQDFRSEVMNLFETNNYTKNNNIKLDKNYNRKIKNISLFDNPSSKNTNNTLNHTLITPSTNTTKDKIRSFVHTIEKDITIGTYNNRGSNSNNSNKVVNIKEGKNKSPNGYIKEYFSPNLGALKNKHTHSSSTLLQDNHITLRKNNNSSTTNNEPSSIKNKMNNYLTLASPKEINVNLYPTTKQKADNNSNPLFKVEEVKNLTSKLKFLTDREIKKMDSQYLNELKNLANVINKITK